MFETQEIEQLIAFRKALHAHPELSGEEKDTSNRVVNFLKECNPSQIITQVGGYGVIAVFDSEKEGHNLMIRADMDALPIEEVNDFDYLSKNKGVSHKCGHDGHTIILLGLAKRLSKNPPNKGKAILLFQPAEEIGTGAAVVLNDEKFKSLKPDWVFGLHNLPGYQLHEVVVKNDSFTASVKSIVIVFQGKTTHAAEPEHGINPAMAVSELILQASFWSNNLQERKDFAVITPIHIDLGSEAYGTSAGQATVGFTIRTWTESEMKKLQEKMESFILAIAKKHKLKADFKYIQEFKANENNAEAVKSITTAANNLGYIITNREFPFKWGEDFGLFTQQHKGAFFGIGAGKNCPALHNPDYDFPDELIPTGIQLFYELCKNYIACP
ncbi:MAG: amidohydrolase [Flavobacteriaceae bacterium CG2_30_34_30]|nr:amidohydrolase [Flavobacteriia bacterium]OIP49461.1 MAG: amidohydrolase [Flavobacteriaceae bacterium CG2_30_34_30]PIQ17915.1 MAG: amidohydrolase [Flavobacteriaceae bacterium CG18_big_fil_WC_8_21_14_2_50_34_36]PIV50130.1 MAG: amidohydrolase [Flavobacteriaceae bacterium CG02_land_8_20_14_3_00_34_13]PIZ08985.1 MAG: amidohydrolase [Flavobacteriaceae bacterium CG_4_10_14_0_8_um_filter_34_31]PJC06854.1 MAG: amidohydrolase [Flavobacteriaceae bacterium CG_4_9_14_0_8_um_filter_34_30]